jgi:hypothetical protein
MAIFEEKAYGVQCDLCGKIFEDPFTGFSLYVDKYSAMEKAQDYSWIEHKGRWYCPSCYEYDLNEEIVIKSSE